MKSVFVIVLALNLVVWTGCNSAQTAEETIPQTFPRVELPAMLNSGEGAAAYMLEHYWNPFLDSARLAKVERARLPKKGTPADSLILGVDSVALEEAFGEYAFIATQLQPVNYPIVATAVKELVQRADRIALQGDSSLLFKLLAFSEKYFYDPNSPVLNEEVYIPILQAVLASRSLNDLDKMQYEYQLRIASLNRVGSAASDFEYTTVSGKGSLYRIKGEYTLIFFNNPDCHTCHQILEELKQNPDISRLIRGNRLKLLAMYTDQELDKWVKNKSMYPPEWIYAHDAKFILRENSLYGLRAIPSLYLLDKDKKVILKDAPAAGVMQYLSRAVPAE